jgi:hypothetical protein
MKMDIKSKFDEISLPVLINLFCSTLQTDSNPTPTEFKSELEGYGIDKLNGHKLYLFFRNILDENV